jgi:prophage maintenance system killer protein
METVMDKRGNNQIVIYRTNNGKSEISVSLDKNTVWLTQEQMSELFSTERTVITKHLGNVFKSGELDRKSVCAKFAHTAGDGKSYQTQFYNLDAIISVGYRVNSKRGTQFRMWATNVLKEHIVKGYTRNENRLNELKQTIRLVENVVHRQEISSNEAKALLEVITDYSYALDTLDDYDYQKLSMKDTTTADAVKISYDEAISVIAEMRKKFNASKLFGLEKDASVKSSLNVIFQTYGKKELYPSLEEKAANLLYFLVKNHSFVDGNKRIAAFLFIWFLSKNNFLYREDGSKRIADNALVALTLMIAESRSEEKDVLVKVIVNLINRKNQ